MADFTEENYMPFQNIPDIIITTLYLYNLSIIQKDEFNMEWTINIEQDLQEEANKEIERITKTKVEHQKNIKQMLVEATRCEGFILFFYQIDLVLVINKKQIVNVMSVG